MCLRRLMYIFNRLLFLKEEGWRLPHALKRKKYKFHIFQKFRAQNKCGVESQFVDWVLALKQVLAWSPFPSSPENNSEARKMSWLDVRSDDVRVHTSAAGWLFCLGCFWIHTMDKVLESWSFKSSLKFVRVFSGKGTLILDSELRYSKVLAKKDIIVFHPVRKWGSSNFV